MTGAFHSRFAQAVTVTDSAGQRTARAFIQPVSVSAPEAPAATPAGIADRRRWLLIMEPMALSGRAEITAPDGTVYLLLRREDVSGHIEGVLARKGGGGGDA